MATRQAVEETSTSPRSCRRLGVIGPNTKCSRVLWLLGATPRDRTSSSACWVQLPQLLCVPGPTQRARRRRRRRIIRPLNASSGEQILLKNDGRRTSIRPASPTGHGDGPQARRHRPEQTKARPLPRRPARRRLRYGEQVGRGRCREGRFGKTTNQGPKTAEKGLKTARKNRKTLSRRKGRAMKI